MADGYDRFDNEGSGGGSFVMGLLTGTVLGAGLGMLFAPKSGSELRSQLSEQAGNIANQASDAVQFTLVGPTDQASNEIPPDTVATLKVDLQEGDYEVTAGEGSDIRPDSLTVGPARPTSQNELLQP